VKKVLLLLGLLVIPGLVAAGVYWKRARSTYAHQLAIARPLLGTRQGTTVIEALASRFPNQGEAQFLYAQQLRLDEQYELAEESLNRAANLGWPKEEVERQRWLCRASLDFRKAEAQLQGLLDRNPQDREVLLSLAQGYSRIDRPQMAELLLNRILQQDPDDGAALCVRGKVRLQQFQADRAAKDLEKAVLLGKDKYYSLLARIMLGTSLRQLGDVDKAYQIYRECQKEAPENVRILYDLGLCAHYLNRLDEALEAFNAVLQRRPNDTETLLQIAYIYEERKELDKALEVVRQVEQSYPEEPQMLVQMAKILQASGDTSGAAAYRQRYETVKKKWEQRNEAQVDTSNSTNLNQRPP
jgi:tetratricopeptide (TPR) repeat protein